MAKDRLITTIKKLDKKKYNKKSEKESYTEKKYQEF